jgi:hypothetical protein
MKTNKSNVKDSILVKFGDVFSQWGLTATPFAVEALNSDAKGERLLKGRDAEINEIVHNLHKEGRITCVDGQYGTGKTSLVNVATFKCLEAYESKDSNQILIPCSESFQLKDDLDIDGFVETVLFHVVVAINASRNRLGTHFNTDQLSRLDSLIGSPILKLSSEDVSNSIGGGVAGFVKADTTSKRSSAESVNSTRGFQKVGYEATVKTLLKDVFTVVPGGVVCIIDNIELLETGEKARKILELLRDRLFTTKGLRWVFCGANGVIRSLAASPRLGAFFSTPLDLKNVEKSALSDVINARIQEYSSNVQTTWNLLPVGMEEITWLYEVLNLNLRDLLSTLALYCEEVSRKSQVIPSLLREAKFVEWVVSAGEADHRAISRNIDNNAWIILDVAMSDVFSGSFTADQFGSFNTNSLKKITETNFKKLLKDLKTYDVLTQSLPEIEQKNAADEIDLKTYSVSSKGALIFFYRQAMKENQSAASHVNWLKRVNR